MVTRRQARVAESIRSTLSSLILKNVDDPQLAWVTITDVDPSPDLRNAKIYFVATGIEDCRPLLKGLTRAAPRLQRELAKTMTSRFTPKLSFHYDDSFDEGQRIDEILHNVVHEQTLVKENETVEQTLARLLTAAQSILVCGHRNPDGDVIGSMLGMSQILKMMGKDHVVYCPDTVPELLRFLPGADEVATELFEDDQFDLTLLLDTADAGLLPTGFPEPEQRGDLVVIDHHMTHGDIGDLIIRREVSSVGEMLFDLGQELFWPMNADTAQCLYASVVADTGSFRYSSTTPTTHRVAANLMEAGAEPWAVATALYESFPVRRQRLLAEVLSTLEISEDGHYSLMYSTPAMLAKVGANKADLDGMINFGRSIGSVYIAAMFRLEPDGQIKVSFRSKGECDVAQIASTFGGGGHRNAAGCTLHDVELPKAIEMISAVAKECLANLDNSPKN